MKKVLFLAAMLPLSIGMSAQGFARFQAEGVKGKIRNFKNKPSKIEVIVDSNVDIEEVEFKYKLLANCQLETEISEDFSKAQKVVVTNKDGQSKEWILEVKQLDPASLPLDIQFNKKTPAIWTGDTEGWVNFGTDETKNTVARFGNNGVYFTAGFEDAAEEVSFDLYAVGKKAIEFDGTFLVETSADGKKWKAIKGFKDSDITIDSKFTCPLKKSDRFVRWTYLERKKNNINLNNISIK